MERRRLRRITLIAAAAVLMVGAAGLTWRWRIHHAGSAASAGATYYWLVFAADQADFTTAPGLSTSPIQSFTAR